MVEFSIVEDARALVRFKGGILKITNVYARNEKHFIPFRGGFVRICAKLGAEYPTCFPDIKVIELEL